MELRCVRFACSGRSVESNGDSPNTEFDDISDNYTFLNPLNANKWSFSSNVL